MTAGFIPATRPATGAGGGADTMPIRNDPFYPDLTAAALRAETGLGEIFGLERVAATLKAAMAETNAALAPWRTGLPALPNGAVPARLADIPAPEIDGERVNLLHYRAAVFARARACLIEMTRDYDATADGHARADALGDTADVWLQRANEALARLTGRTRMAVALI